MQKKWIVMLLTGLCLYGAAPAGALELSAFGDVTFSDSNLPGETGGFSLGQLDFWATRKLDKDGQFTVFMELVVESSEEGFVIDLERLWVQAAVSPSWHIRAGRLHTSLGYWNRVHHHGAHMQTSVARPLFLDFEDGSTAVLPTHIVGLMAISQFDIAIFDTPASSVTLELQAGNGAHHNGEELDPNTTGDNDDTKGYAARIAFAPHDLEGLGIGFSLNYNQLQQTILTTTPTTTSDWVDQMIYEADLSFVDKLTTGLELISEYYVVHNKDPVGTSYTTSFWYAQVGMTFQDFVTPYARYESFEDLDKKDPYFKTLGTSEYALSTIGMRFDFNLTRGAETAIKIEAGRKEESGQSSTSYALQWTFGF